MSVPVSGSKNTLLFRRDTTFLPVFKKKSSSIKKKRIEDDEDDEDAQER